MHINRKIVLYFVTATIIAVASIVKIFDIKPPQDNKIIVSSVSEKDLIQTSFVMGTIESNSIQEIFLDDDVKITKVMVEKGQSISAGDKLIELDKTDIGSKIKIESINMQSKLARLNILKNKVIRENPIKFEIDNKQIDYEDLKAKYEQSEKLYQAGSISKQELEDQRKDLLKEKNELQLLKERLLNEKSDVLDEIEELNADIKVAKETINSLSNTINDKTNALIAGKVLKMEIKNNKIVNPDIPQIVICDLSKYKINVEVSQRQALYLKKGENVEISVSGISKPYIGTIEDIDECANNNSENAKEAKVKVIIVISNPDAQIRIGYKAEVHFKTILKEAATIIDFEGIVSDRYGDKYVYFVDGDTAIKRKVKTGIETEFDVELLEGLISGDKYVLNPPEKLQKKDRMKIWGYDYQ